MAFDLLYIIGSMDIGGSELHLRTIAPELSKRGLRVAIYSLSDKGPLRGELESEGVTVLAPPVSRRSRSGIAVRVLKLSIVACHLFWTMIRYRPRIVHFFLPHAYLTGAPVALLARIPVRLMSRRSLNNYQQNYPAFRPAERFCHKTMNAVLGNSRSVLSQLAEEGVPEQKLVLIYNGIDFSRFSALAARAELRRGHDIDEQALVLTIVANLIPYKGHRDLINALGAVAPKLPPGWRVLIVGRDDGIGTGLRALATSLGIAENTVFLGPRTDVSELWALSDIGLSCSHQEGFSNAILEAMGAGLPTVVTDVGGNPEAVVNGETGIVVPPADPARLAAAIVTLASSPELRERYGRAGAARAHHHFSLPRCVGQYAALYEGLVAGRLPAEIAGLDGLEKAD